MDAGRRGFIGRTVRWGTGLVSLFISESALKLGYNFIEGGVLPLEVAISCRFHSGSYNQFAGERSSFEKTSDIENLNKEFMRDGRILDFRIFKSDNGIVWKYVFRSKADYKAWNKFVYHGGLFSRSKLKKNYEILISKRYLVPGEIGTLG